MVGILVKQLAPANRGLARRSGSEIAAAAGIGTWSTSEAYDHQAYRNLPIDRGVTDFPEPHSSSSSSSFRNQRRKPLRAMAILTSLATDLDLVTDWVFYFDTVYKDKQYCEQYRRHPIVGEPSYLIPPLLKHLVFTSCVIGTIMWLIIASDGRLLTPGLRLLGVDNLSMGFILFICVLIEDIPQVILTFLVEDYFEDGHYFSSSAVCNLMTSIYDSVIKLAEAFDERGDIVETGFWCKKSIWAHHNVVTAVQTLPSRRKFSGIPSRVPSQRSLSGGDSSGNLSQPSIERHPPKPIVPDHPPPVFLQEGMVPVIQTPLPRLRFLTTSLDKTIRLWDTAIPQQEERDKSIHTYRGHTEGVNCICLVGPLKTPVIADADNLNSVPSEEDDDHNTYFLSGCRNGTTKLWNVNGDFIRSFYLALDVGNSVNGIAIVKERETFICGHRDGSARLWEALTGVCIARYVGHSSQILCVCSLRDNAFFVTGSEDETLRLWDTKDAMLAFKTYDTFHEVVTEVTNHRKQEQQAATIVRSPWGRAQMAASRFISEQALHEERVCVKTFVSHTAPVLCVANLQPGVTLISGSADCTARIWSINTGRCLRVFSHPDRVSALTAIDSTALLTGCHDKTVRVWDALAGTCLRNFSGHEDYITGICMAGGEVFVTSSADQTVKVWVLTTVPHGPKMMLHNILEMNEGQLCRPVTESCA